MSFKKDFQQLKFALETAVKHNVQLDKHIDPNKAMLDYDLNQRKYYQQALQKAIKKVKNAPLQLQTIVQDSAVGQEKLNHLMEILPQLDTTNIEELQKFIKKIDLLIKYITFPSERKESFIKIPKNIPSDIRSDVVLDLKELEKCYKNECYRSSVILCGRVLEAALHRKYYDVTGQDILEKSPGIGLGNLIAKLKEKNVALDPALTNQIHLVNQVRVFSVHKKKEAFSPSEQQTQAMILYTLDILEKLF
ncbi:hypothetical protein CEE44_01570 [Candidatus Woesearchaeota archaeon B3_Woes]|nr:MAG: hypothetical protein CEE44_01570 [Candidatus Woesearchaeota archaeon B3_Woes]